jgi:hypothetical protein
MNADWSLGHAGKSVYYTKKELERRNGGKIPYRIGLFLIQNTWRKHRS